MNIIYLMIPCTFFLVIGFVVAFVWAGSSEQFEDLETPALRAINEDFKVDTKKKG